MSPGKLIYAMLIATTLALALVWQSAERRAAGYHLADLRSEIEEQKVLGATYRGHVSRLKNPMRIMELMERYGIELAEQTPAPAAEPETEAGPAPPRAARPDSHAAGSPTPEPRN